LLSFSNCTKEPVDHQLPFLILKQGAGLTPNGAAVPVGGRLVIGISGSGSGSPITNISAIRFDNSGRKVMSDAGVYIPVGGLDTTLYFVKGGGGTETWRIFIMNARRDTTSVSISILQGEGSAYGEINHYQGIRLGYQGNSEYNNYVDLTGGNIWNNGDVGGNESMVDMVAIWYITSGKSSPTLSAPSYSSLTGYFPAVAGWPVRNGTVFDYKTSDNNLISQAQFEAASNDSLMVAGFNDGFTSGWCKYALTGKVIPFKTSGGRYGLIRVVTADENSNGYMEIDIKVQKQ
jgi:hypothetical protein